MEAWRTSCPRHPTWEDACADGLPQVESGPGINEDRVILTEHAEAMLDEN